MTCLTPAKISLVCSIVSKLLILVGRLSRAELVYQSYNMLVICALATTFTLKAILSFRLLEVVMSLSR